MHENAIKFLKLMFKENETICVSNSKYGYHAIPRDNAWKEKVTLFSPNPDIPVQYVPSDQINLVALNPIRGFREDTNCTSFRNFMVEMDNSTQEKQLEYVKASGMPYSACVFSGNKSLHFLVSLSQDLPSEAVWRLFAEWTLNILPLADPLTKNPSRSIRIPESYREPDKLQKLIEFHGPVSLKDFTDWLKKWPSAKPIVREKKQIKPGEFDLQGIKQWVIDELNNGIDERKGRNARWYSIAMEFALNSYSEDGTIEILDQFFSPDRTFKEKEWLTTIKSAFKRAYDRK